MQVNINQPVLHSQNQHATLLREQWTKAGTLVVHLVSSPGSGKTSLLEATARHWQSKYRLGILVGDIATDRDAERLSPLAPTQQLTTGGACHLEIPLVQKGWEKLGITQCEFLFIENVGNLVCPASYDLGEHLRVVLLSATEGDDKPGKYPKMFRSSQVLVITKTDLLPHVPFKVEAATQDARHIQPRMEVICVSAIQRSGIAEWCSYLEEKRNTLLASLHE